MAQSKDDIKYGAAQAKLSDDEMLRVGYKHGTPLESGKISDAEPVDLFVDARRISEATKNARPAEDDPNSGGLSCQGSHHTCKNSEPRVFPSRAKEVWGRNLFPACVSGKEI
ncbi:hypothetical protein OPV22_000983 [Ensete ventricosum]|uniref:Uncharacterized protein n=1 Tax=Ensete ventricosum TaxID=4639 RepID=A0AAV8RW13_ENSVE|nr:hypothetical protein OPV22_000983 [Ensete ventricosum]